MGSKSTKSQPSDEESFMDTKSSFGENVQAIMKGCPVQIIDTSNHTLTLNENALKNILLRDDVASRKVVVISVAGAFRKGKSFLLNFFLRYLKSEDKANWLDDDTSDVDGFSWKSGTELDTTGILLWSEPFFIKTESGEDIAILLMDTQGSFDSQSTVKDCATVFALSTMLSSIQIYNLSSNIQENDLQNLHFFTEYGRVAMEAVADKPFQNLTFLIRDWPNSHEHSYGFTGGKELLNKRLQIPEKQHAELQCVRLHIRECFDDVGCFLMPYPGQNVAMNQNLPVQLQDIDYKFKKQLNVLIPQLLDPAGLAVKKINGQEITASELFGYFQAYVKIFRSGIMPDVKSAFEAHAEANNMNAVYKATKYYMDLMKEGGCDSNDPIDPEKFRNLHEQSYPKAIEIFKSIPKIGGNKYNEKYLAVLKDQIQCENEILERINKTKGDEKFWRNMKWVGIGIGAAAVGAVLIVVCPAVLFFLPFLL